MADLSDVESSLVTVIAGLLYPNGTGQPSSVGIPCKVFAGWPTAAQLDADLVAGVANVSVYPTQIERNTTRYPRDNWLDDGIGGLIREIRRQERVFQISVWCDTPTHRDVVASTIDSVLSITQFLNMPDGFGARLVYRNSSQSDGGQKSKLYRRDLHYSVEYATTERTTATPITQIDVGISMQPDGVATPISTTTIHIT